MEQSRNLLVLKPTLEPQYLRALAAALPLGRPVLLEGMGEGLDAALEPVLLKQTFKSVSTPNCTVFPLLCERASC